MRSDSESAQYTTVVAYVDWSGQIKDKQRNPLGKWSYQFKMPQKSSANNGTPPNEDDNPWQAGNEEQTSWNNGKEYILKLNGEIKVISTSVNDRAESVVVWAFG